MKKLQKNRYRDFKLQGGKVKQKKAKPKGPPTIKAFFSDEEMARIEAGPLGATSGRGKAAWLRNVALKATELWEKGVTE
jgi:hypothetical protein